MARAQPLPPQDGGAETERGAAPSGAEPTAPPDAGPTPSPDAEPDEAEPPDPEHAVTGIAEEGREEGDTARAIGSAALYVPRKVIDWVFRGTAATASLIADKQLVPRYRELLGAPPDGDVLVFPTLFAETGSPLAIGLRALVDTPWVATYQRVGYGIPSDFVTESRVILKGHTLVPYVVSFEAYLEDENEIEYHGIGITPDRDRRNRFRSSVGPPAGLYSERRVRGLTTLGMRLWPELEVFLSASLSRRHVEDTPDAGDEALSRVFEPGSVAGTGHGPWIGYGEMAARFDSRKHLGKPTPGAVVEAYTGGAHSTEGTSVAFLRMGWRLGGFIPIYRQSNILSPRLVVDGLVPLGELDVPFNELPRQPEYRGFDTRRDNVSIVASLDYTWLLVPFMGLRLFMDGATVAPKVAELELRQLFNLRYALGLGIDLYADKAQLAQLAVSTGPEGVRVLFSLGAAERFGDRQHRD
ncbi:MAG: hypothetical protein JRI68_05505 [Deltaproteobacteria bacterium]|nr:hypothetical protein [Deltaproteobacteria bacterium]